MLITFNNVSFKYIDKVLLNNVNFTINETDKIGLLGVNGVGKSTLLKLLVSELEPTSGIIYKKNNIKIAYLPQETNFVLGNTILEEIQRITKTKEEEAFNMKSILNKLGLDDHSRIIKELSGGEKKRLALACTLITPADLIILDEPTAFLDIANRFIITQLLQKIAHEWGKLIIFSTHDLQLAIDMCDKIWLMAGDGFYDNTPQQLMDCGAFGKLFDDSRMVFNQTTRSFEMLK
jgi:ATP-binding cassette subfamily F protein uup